MGKYILALDQGVSGSKATLIDHKGKAIAWVETSLKPVLNKSGWIEYKPDDILKSILSALNSLFRKIGTKKRQISAIGIANQPSTVILWDKDTGKAVYNAISPIDPRGIEICRENSDHRESVRERTGLPLSSAYSAAKIRWILDNIKQTRKLIEKGRLLCGTINTFLMWHLTKGAVFATDHSNAAKTLLFNILTKSWDKELLELFAIPHDILPAVLPTSSYFGDARIHGQTIPVQASIVDRYISLIGNGCHQEGDANINYGKDGAILINTGKKPFPLPGLLTTIGWSNNGNTSYILEGNIKAAGLLFQWMQEKLGILGHKEDLDDMCRRSQERIFVFPAITGLGSPYPDKNATGCIFGLKLSTTKYDIVRSAVEAIAFMVKDHFSVIEKDNRIKVKKIIVSGGLSELTYLLQFQSDILNMPLHKAKEDGQFATGIAFLTNPDTNSVHGLNSAEKKPATKGSFVPRADEAGIRKLYERWRLTCLHSREWSKNFS